jgi:hypothetical protein
MEENYVPAFEGALAALKKAGRSVTRSGWNGKGMFLTLQVPDTNSKMTLPYIFMSIPKTQDNEDTPFNRVPWLVSQTDLLVSDWEVLPA